MTDRPPLDQLDTIPLPVIPTVRTTVTDSLKSLLAFLAYSAAVLIGCFLAVCVFLAAQQMWGQWDAGFWRYFMGGAAILAAVVVYFRVRARREARSYSRAGY